MIVTMASRFVRLQGAELPRATRNGSRVTVSSTDIPAKVERLGDKLARYTSRLVFSFIDINAYKKVGGNLKKGGVNAREFTPDEMCEVAQRIGELARG